MNLTLLYTFYSLVALIFSFLINGLFLRFSKNLGTRDIESGQVRWSETSKPSLGGISFFITFLLSIISYTIFFEQSSIFGDKHFAGILIACISGFLMGLADDAYNTKPILKFSVQLACGLILIYTDTYIKVFSNEYLNYVLTLFWVVGIMNSINMLDNMDAITTSVSIVITLCFILIIFFYKDFTSVNLIVSLGVLSSLLGFLYYNINPSKLYMGDTGSQFLGIFLAAMGIKYFWNFTDTPAMVSYPTKQLIVTLLIFIIPITDTATVFINRIARRKSPFIGGKDHTTHHLSYKGLTDSQVALTLTFISLISLFLIWVIIYYLKDWSIIHFFIFLSYILLVAGWLYYNTKTTKAH
jgi:UDP-GlcNAc:undecaprenyl-phosphate GlcNAc-1-phosphate transferase